MNIYLGPQVIFIVFNKGDLKKMKKIEDFGKKIGGARKDEYGLYGLLLSDYQKMSDEEKKEACTKANIWPKMNYEKLIEDGYNNIQVGWAKMIYDSIDRAPYDQKDGEKYFEFVNNMKKWTLDGMKMPYDEWKEYINYSKSYDNPECFARRYRDYRFDPQNSLLLLSNKSNKIGKAVANDEFNVISHLFKKQIFLTHEQRVKLSTSIATVDGNNASIETDYRGKTVLKIKTLSSIRYHQSAQN